MAKKTTTKKPSRKTGGAKTSRSAKSKTPVKARKSLVKKGGPGARKLTPKPTGGKAVARKASPRKKTPVAIKKAVPKKAAPKKAAPKKIVLKKAVLKKAVPKKTAPKKIVLKKAVPKKAVSKKAVPKKTVSKKAMPKKTMPKKTAPKKSLTKMAVKTAHLKKRVSPKAPPKKQPAKKVETALKTPISRKTRPAGKTVTGQRPSINETAARRLAARKAQAQPVSKRKPPASRPVKAQEPVDTHQPSGFYNGIDLTREIKPFPGKTPYSKGELMDLRTALLEERERLTSHLTTLSGVSMEALVNAKEHAGYSVHIAESATDLQTAEANLGVRSIEEARLAEVDEALERIKHNLNHFGLCLACGNKIGIQRLKARPHAHLCMPCRKRYEEIRSRRGY